MISSQIGNWSGMRFSVDPAFELVGAAANGQIALAKIPQVNPDVITLDWEMPEMTGVGTLKAIGLEYPHLPVVMVLPPHHGLPVLDSRSGMVPTDM